MLSDIPSAASLWDAEKNGVPAEEAFAGSTVPSWWFRVECGHSWLRRISTQVKMCREVEDGVRDTPCAVCSGNVLVVGVNDFGTVRADLAKFWDSANELKPSEVTPSSAKRVGWCCPSCGYKWLRKIKDEKGVCRQCAPRNPPVRGLLKDLFPDLFAELVPDQVLGNPLDGLPSRSNQKVRWVCAEGHEFESRISNRTILGRGCPYCAGRYPVVGVNDLGTLHPELVEKFWAYDLNSLKPFELKPASNKLVWWRCEKGHEWEAKPHLLIQRNQYCPFCSGKRIIVGVNDIVVAFPKVGALYHPTKNTVDVATLSKGLGKRFWWVCSKGHDYEASVYQITYAVERGKEGCPVCSGDRVMVGVNDAGSAFPDLVKEWHPTKNGDKTLFDYSTKSGIKVWWQCEKGHEWRTAIGHRSGGDQSGCPECGRVTSKGEDAVAEFVEGLGFTVVRNTRKILGGGFEVDVYIPERKVGVEFNGVYWHSDVRPGQNPKGRHHHKWELAETAGVQLFQIWEDDWLERPEQVKALLKRKLGVDKSKSVYARNTTPTVLTAREAYPFLNEHHLQGKASGSAYLGLRDIETGVLVAVGVFLKVGDLWRLERYATSTRVPGGFTKLLTQVKELDPEMGGVYTFSDHCVSDGGLYEKNGFVVDKVLPPDYMYVVGNRREHKFRYRLKRFRDDPNLAYQDGMTEQELAKLNGLHRVWDAGKTRWLLKW